MDYLTYMVPDDSLAAVLSSTMEFATGGGSTQHHVLMDKEYVDRLFSSYGVVGTRAPCRSFA